MRKIINSATTQYEPVLTEELVLDDRPISGSFNSITSDAVYKAISVDPGNVPPVESTDDGKVLTASYGEGGGSFEWATPSGGSDIPEYTTDDADKVLGVVVDSSGDTPVASLDWVAQGGGSSYTAGDGININNNEISVRAGDGLELGTFTGALKVSNPLPPSAVGDAGKVLTVNSSGNPEWATPSGGSSSAFNTTFNLIDDGTHVYWRAAAISSSETIDLPDGEGVYAYRVNAKIDVSAAVDDVYNIEVCVGPVYSIDCKAIGLQSNSNNYLTYRTSGILNIESGTGILKASIFVKVTPAKSSGASSAVFTGGTAQLMLAKL